MNENRSANRNISPFNVILREFRAHNNGDSNLHIPTKVFQLTVDLCLDRKLLTMTTTQKHECCGNSKLITIDTRVLLTLWKWNVLAMIYDTSWRDFFWENIFRVKQKTFHAVDRRMGCRWFSNQHQSPLDNMVPNRAGWKRVNNSLLSDASKLILLGTTQCAIIDGRFFLSKSFVLVIGFIAREHYVFTWLQVTLNVTCGESRDWPYRILETK